MAGKCRPRATTGRLWGAVLAASLLLAGTASVQALDFNDVQNLVRNQVAEGVIINMVQQDPNLAITQDQANQLRAMGASESLVYAIRPAAGYPVASAPTATATYPAPTTTTYPAPTVAGGTYPATTYPADGGAYAGSVYQDGGAYGDYDVYDSDYDDYEAEYYQQQGLTTPSYPAGTVVQQTPVYDSAVTYVDPAPTTVYQQAPQVIVQQAPTVVYDTTPTYVYPSRPSFGFNVHFGGRDRDRWHRPPPPPPSYHRPPSHRPPPPPPPRPGGHDRPGGNDRPGGGKDKPDRPGSGGPGKPPRR